MARHEGSAEAEQSARLFLQQATQTRVCIKDFRDAYFPYCGDQIKDYFEELKTEVAPDLIVTHSEHDVHQDHRVIHQLTWNTFRQHLIVEYEIPKYDGDLGRPNLYVPLDEGTCRRKIGYIVQSFASQADKHWFTESTFLAVLRMRGVEAASELRPCRGLLLP